VPYDVLGFARDAVLDALRAGGRSAGGDVDPLHVAMAFTSERHLRRPGPPLPPTFAALSRFACTRDGWIRLHANYPHHHAALLAALGCAEDQALDAIAERDAVELEDAVVAAGGVAAAVRTADDWARHEQGSLLAGQPLVRASTHPAGLHAEHARTRVLDLTRVIAGPVATRFLAALGADVLRIDPPWLPELEGAVLDGGVGKRLVSVDLRSRTGLVHDLLGSADVLVHGYRPGALAALGLSTADLAERHPHLVVGSLSAWGDTGPWGDRRGFDSLVQAASGIADHLRGPDGAPGALPAQALDHGTGYLLAAAVLRALAQRRDEGTSAHVALALARTAQDLVARPGDGTLPLPAEPEAYLQDLGDLTVVAPPRFRDGPVLGYPHGPRPGEPVWLPEAGGRGR
jgi:crotonobetainyl-CoA:carnitine CoA-transferase CaiB-like acyl-CoA transferase